MDFGFLTKTGQFWFECPQQGIWSHTFAVHANNNSDPAAQRLDGDVPRERFE